MLVSGGISVHCSDSTVISVQFVSSDATSMAISIVISNLVYDVVSSLAPYLSKNNFIGQIA